MAMLSIAALAAGFMLTGADRLAPNVATELCLDDRNRQTAAALIGKWSENYPFSRVIIGNDGQYGDVGIAGPAVVGVDYVVCGASYNLIKVGRNAKSYSVTIDRFYFRVTVADGTYRVSLEDLPASLEGSNVTSRELIGRFKIDGRPYADILTENQRRVEARRQ